LVCAVASFDGGEGKKGSGIRTGKKGSIILDGIRRSFISSWRRHVRGDSLFRGGEKRAANCILGLERRQSRRGGRSSGDSEEKKAGLQRWIGKRGAVLTGGRVCRCRPLLKGDLK